MAVTKVKGYMLNIKWGDKLIRGLQTSGIKMKPNYEEALLKVLNGYPLDEVIDYDSEFTASGQTYEMDSGESGTYEDFQTLREAAAAGAIVAFIYGRFTIGENIVTGNAQITDYSEEGNSKDTGTYSITFKAVRGSVSFTAQPSSFISQYGAIYDVFVTKPPSDVATAQNAIVASLVTAGIWAKLDRFFLYQNYSNGDGESLKDWIHPTGASAELAIGAGGTTAPAFTSLKGFKGNGGTAKGYIISNYNPSTQGVLFTQNSATVGAYIITKSDGGDILIGNAGTGNTALAPYYVGFRSALNNLSVDWTDRSPSVATGHVAIVRDAANKINVYRGKTESTDISSESAAINNFDLNILRGNGNYYSTAEVGMAYMGGALTESEIGVINDAMVAYQDALEEYTYDILNTAAFLGDSTIGTYGAGAAVCTLMNATGKTFINAAVSGGTFASQYAAWQALGAKRKVMDYVFIEIGLNDIETYTVQECAALCQTFVNNIRSDIGTGGRIVLCTMTPARGSSRDYNKWLGLNEAIMGTGSYAITGADRLCDTANSILNDGSGYLKEEYRLAGDYLHENNAGRQVIANMWDAIINELGF
jgi:lysophospholipase L1-like esterase